MVLAVSVGLPRDALIAGELTSSGRVAPDDHELVEFGQGADPWLGRPVSGPRQSLLGTSRRQWDHGPMPHDEPSACCSCYFVRPRRSAMRTSSASERAAIFSITRPR